MGHSVSCMCIHFFIGHIILTLNNILKSNRIMSFSEDSKGCIWIGSFLTGLYSYDLKSGG